MAERDSAPSSPPRPAPRLSVRQAQAARLLGIWVVVAVAEAVAWRYLVRGFYRDFFLPVTIAILIAGVAASWRSVRGRHRADRRGGDRRSGARRDSRP